MSRRKKHGGGHGDDERWLLTYADMITLLLALFIVLFAMSSIEPQRFENLRRTLSQTFQGQILDEPGGIAPGATGVLDPSSPSANAARQVARLQAETAREVGRGLATTEQRLTKQAKAAGLGGKVQVQTTERGIVIRLAGDGFFDSGSARIKPGLRTKLVRIADELRAESRPISVEGHTDGQPMYGGGSNLRLSLDRAAAVYEVLRGSGIPGSELSARGYAEFQPLVEPRTPTEPVAENRRVEIVVLAPGADKLAGMAEAETEGRRSGGAGGVSDPAIQIARPIVAIGNG